MTAQAKKLKHKILFLLVFNFLLSNLIQAQYWEGYGLGLNYARIQNDTIFYEVGRIHDRGTDHYVGQILECQNLTTGINTCKALDNETLEFKYNLNVEIALDYDTIKIYHSKSETKHVFIKGKQAENQLELIKQIEIKSFSESYILKRRTTIDFSGIIKTENFENDSIINIEITENEMDAIRSSIQYLNYTELNNLNGKRNFTGHESEIGFRFITEDNSQYDYISIKVPDVLEPLLMVVYELRKTETNKTER